ncbi:hypothetical protein VTO42DRAFT_515 [Malbranchea cinnamomea]
MGMSSSLALTSCYSDGWESKHVRTPGTLRHFELPWDSTQGDNVLSLRPHKENEIVGMTKHRVQSSTGRFNYCIYYVGRS